MKLFLKGLKKSMLKMIKTLTYLKQKFQEMKIH